MFRKSKKGKFMQKIKWNTDCLNMNYRDARLIQEALDLYKKHRTEKELKIKDND